MAFIIQFSKYASSYLNHRLVRLQSGFKLTCQLQPDGVRGPSTCLIRDPTVLPGWGKQLSLPVSVKFFR